MEYPSGKLRQSGSLLANGKRNGLWLELYESGNLKAEGYYENGNKIGVWTWYYESVDDIRNKSIEGKFDREGHETGAWTFWFPNGKVAEKGSFVNGRRSGLWVEYWENGKVKAEGYYQEGREIGIWTYYRQDGNKLSQGMYDGKGKKIGIWKNWDKYHMLTEVDEGVSELGNWDD